MIEKRNAGQTKRTDVIKTFEPIHLSFDEINCERTYNNQNAVE